MLLTLLKRLRGAVPLFHDSVAECNEFNREDPRGEHCIEDGFDQTIPTGW
jgi:hypothetical protein